LRERAASITSYRPADPDRNSRVKHRFCSKPFTAVPQGYACGERLVLLIKRLGQGGHPPINQGCSAPVSAVAVNAA
jgi:hypothetical protein